MATAVDDAVADAVADGVPFVVAGTVDADGRTTVSCAGARDDAGTPATPDTVLDIFSVTKLFTATAALQCVEDGLFTLDIPASDLVPAIGALEVLVGIDDDDTVHTRPVRTPITVGHLLHHTSGLGYDMFDSRCARLARARAARPSETPLWDGLQTPLLHDPGERWTYGTSSDWLGLVIAAARGRRFENVVRERIGVPCGLTDTSFDLTDDTIARHATLRRRRPDGTLRSVDTARRAGAPELDMGGQGLHSTVPDILALLRVWFGDGAGAFGRVLRPETVASAVRGGPGIRPVSLDSAVPALTHRAEFFPGRATSTSASFLVLEDDLPGGRRAGSLSWAGLGNVYWWVDRASGVAAVWATQLLPFFDPACRRAVAWFEQAVYAGAPR